MNNAKIDDLTIRDFFAAAALQGLCAYGEVAKDRGSDLRTKTATQAYELADAMMKAADGK